MVMRRSPLFSALDPQLISSGLQPDRHNLSQVLWEAAVNARFYQGKVRRLVPPSTVFGPLPSTDGGWVRGLSQHQDSAGTRWIWLNFEDKIYRWFGPAAELIGTVQGMTRDNDRYSQTPFVDFQHWGNWTLVNSGSGPIKRFRPPHEGAPAAFENLPNSPLDATAIMKKQNQLFAIGTGINKKRVQWSHSDNIELWAAAATNTAGALPIEELDTGIRAASRLGPNIACYAEDQLALVYWTGPPFYYGQRVQLDGIGAVGKMAVCADGPLNYGVSRNGIWQTDGNTFRYIDEGALNDYLQANVAWHYGGKIVAFRNDVTRCIEFFFPIGGSLEVVEGWAYDPATQSWSPVPPYQFAQERRLFKKPIVGSGATVHMLDDNPAGVGALTLRTKPLLMQGEGGTPLHNSSIVDEIEILAKTATGVEFRYAVAEDIDGPWELDAWQAVSSDFTTYRPKRTPISGTFHKLEFRSVTANWDLDLQGFLMYGEVDGTRRDSL